mmetsp:Transcript_37922/g.60813  ORF Transcript_37922/g.60813 Transcript_37922/m.60813 type:complete len:499 (-) Transcript_37922:361-1857(-)
MFTRREKDDQMQATLTLLQQHPETAKWNRSRLAGALFFAAATLLLVFVTQSFGPLGSHHQYVAEYAPSPAPSESLVIMGWRSQIAQELTKWTHIVAEDFTRFESSLQREGFFGMRVVIWNEQVFFKVLKGEPNPHKGHTLGYTLSTLMAMKQLVWHARAAGAPLRQGVVFHIQFGDGCAESEDTSMPIFGYNNADGYGGSFVNRCKSTVGFPSYDWWWPGQSFQPKAQTRMDLAPIIPWSEKHPVLLFRGNLNSWDGMRIAALWSSHQHPEFIDGKLVELHPGTCELFLRTTEVWGQRRPSEVNFAENCSDIVGKYMLPQDFARYKYWLDIDGHGASFRYKNYLFGDAVIFKVESEYYQHFHRALQPWVHYIPVPKFNFIATLLERVKWARDHDIECQQMVKRTRAWAKEYLTHERTVWYQMEVLAQLTSKLDFEPSTEGMTISCCSDFDKAQNPSLFDRQQGFKKVWGSGGFKGMVRCKDTGPCRSSWKELYSMRNE